MAVTITFTPIPQQTAGVQFTVTGVYTSTTTVWTDTLQYADDAGSTEGSFNVTVPLNTSTGFSFPVTYNTVGSHTVTVLDAASGVTGTSNTFLVVAAKVITLTVSPGVTQGSSYTVTGVLSGYGTAPSLTYAIDDGTPGAVTGVTVSGFTLTLIAPAAGNHKIVVSDGTITGSASFSVSMPGTGISPATPSGVVAGTPFVFTGALQNYTTVPSLTYSVNGGPALTLSGVTLTGWSAVIAIGTSGSTSIRVTDGTSSGTTGSFTVAAAPFVITPSSPTGTQAGVSFNFTGTLSGYTSVPTLSYQIDTNARVIMSGVTTSGWNTPVVAPAAGSHTINVSDGTITSANVPFTTASAPVTITPTSPSGTVTGQSFNFTGTLSGYSVAPALTYSIDGATAVSIPGGDVTTTAFSVPITAPAAGNHTIVVSDGTHTGSTTFTTVSSAPTIIPTTPSGVIAGQAFVFTGVLSNYLTPPALTYSVNGGTPISLTGVTSSLWSDTIVIASSGATTITVTDGTHTGSTSSFTISASTSRTITANNPGSVAAGSTFTFSGALTGYTGASNVITTTGAGDLFTDEDGGVWSISAGLVQLNGQNAGPSAQVIQLALQGTGASQLIWQYNGFNWYSTTPGVPAGSVVYSAGTTASPLATSSASITSTGTGGFFTDEDAGVWTINGGVVQLGGVNAGFSAQVTELALVGTGASQLIWQYNGVNWYSTTPGVPAASVVYSAGTTTSPVAPALTYSINGGAGIALTGVTSSGWSTAITAPSSAGTYTITVTDGSITSSPQVFSVVIVSSNIVDARFQNSQQQAIVDSRGNIWTINVNQQVAINGIVDTTTANVAYLAYVNGVMWRAVGTATTSISWYSNAALAAGSWMAGSNPLPSGYNFPLNTSIAYRNNDVLSTFGVNCSLNAANGSPVTSNGATVASLMNQLKCTLLRWPVVNGGVDSVASSLAASLPTIRVCYQVMLGNSWDFNGSGAGGTPNSVVSNLTNGLATWGSINRFFAVEGQQEVNVNDSNATVSNWVAGTTGFVNAVRSQSAWVDVPCVSLSIGNAPNTSIQNQIGNLVTQSGVNWANIHFYPSNGIDASSLYPTGTNWLSQDFAASAPGRTGLVSEFGYASYSDLYAPNLNNSWCTPAAGAKMTAGAYLTGYYFGSAGSFFYSLTNENGRGYGLFNNSSGSPFSMTSYWIQFLDFMYDNGATASTFSPGSLPFTLSYSGSGTQPFCMITADSSGNYYVILWNNDAVQTGSLPPADVTPSANNTTVTFPTVYSAVTYDFITNSTVSLGSSVSTATLAIQGYPKIIKVTPVSTGPTPPPQAVAAGYTTLVGGFEPSNASSKITTDYSGGTAASFYPYNQYLTPPNVLPSGYTISSTTGLTLNSVVGGFGSGFASVCSHTLCTTSTAPVNGVVPVNNGYGVAFQYGYFEALIETSYTITGANYYPTFWMNGLDNTEPHLEIDIFEINPAVTTAGSGGTSGFNQYGSIICWNGNGGVGVVVPHLINTGGAAAPESQITKSPTVFNLFGMLWTPAGITYYINNVAGSTVSMNTSIPWDSGGSGGTPGNYVGNTISGTQFCIVQIGTGTDGKWPLTVKYQRTWQ